MENGYIMPSVIKTCKTCVKSLFRLCGLDVRWAPIFEEYEGLKKMNIRTILDIGANVGQFASQIHKLLPEATLYSFEPIEECYKELLKTMRGVPKFCAFNYALGDANGQTQLYRNDYTPASSLLPLEELAKQVFPFTANATSQKIEVRRLNDISGELEIVDNLLIKVDVQGTEDKVIFGGENLTSRASVVIIETCFETLYKGQMLFSGIYDLLRERGFVYAGCENTRKSPKDGRILYCDSVFCKAK